MCCIVEPLRTAHGKGLCSEAEGEMFVGLNWRTTHPKKSRTRPLEDPTPGGARRSDLEIIIPRYEFVIQRQLSSRTRSPHTGGRAPVDHRGSAFCTCQRHFMHHCTRSEIFL